jgi:flavodoxin
MIYNFMILLQPANAHPFCYKLLKISSWKYKPFLCKKMDNVKKSFKLLEQNYPIV